MATYAERIAHAEANNLCFACKHNSGAYERLSGVCAKGGLDPEGTAQFEPVLTSQQAEDRRAWATVLWANSCPRFTATETEEA